MLFTKINNVIEEETTDNKNILHVHNTLVKKIQRHCFSS